MGHELITTDVQLTRFCHRLAEARDIAFDTEFVAEHTYRPQLCLVQAAADDVLVVIDPLAVADLTPFWTAVADARQEVVVHAGRSEMLFCLEAVGRQPTRLCDVQLAAGLAGLEYPASYGNLISRLLGRSPPKGETRTDWRRRPLTARQLAYAVDDVGYLVPLRDALHQRLDRLRRRDWLAEETAAWQRGVDAARTEERWWKVSGSSGLASRSLAVVRELWRWREADASRRDRPVRQLLRDDLIVELAKRRVADPGQLAAVRGFERRDLRRIVPELAEAIQRALDLPDKECPQPLRRESNSHLALVGQFLSSALSSICRAQEVAVSLVGTAEDVRELLAWRLEGSDGQPPPALARGWRAEVVGHLLEDLLAGKVAIRIEDPRSDHPLVFDRVKDP